MQAHIYRLRGHGVPGNLDGKYNILPTLPGAKKDWQIHLRFAAKSWYSHATRGSC